MVKGVAEISNFRHPLCHKHTLDIVHADVRHSERQVQRSSIYFDNRSLSEITSPFYGISKAFLRNLFFFNLESYEPNVNARSQYLNSFKSENFKKYMVIIYFGIFLEENHERKIVDNLDYSPKCKYICVNVV